MAMKLFNIITWSFFICFVFQYRSCFADEQNFCDLSTSYKSDSLNLNNQTGYLYLNVINWNAKNRTKCLWIIDIPISRKTIDLSRVVLSSKDNITITAMLETNKTSTIYTIYDNHKHTKISSGLLFVDQYDKLNITLDLDPQHSTFNRAFQIILYINYSDVYLMRDSGSLSFPINQGLTSVIDSKFMLLPSPQYSERLIILTFAKNSTTNFKMDGQQYNQTNLPDIYMAKIDGIKFELNKFNVTLNESIEINYWLVTASCSKEIELNDKNPSSSIIYPNEQDRQDQSLTSMVCAQIFTNNVDKYYEIMITDETTMLPNPGDVITVYSLPKMEVIQTIQSLFIPLLKTINTFLEYKKILIIYDSPYSNHPVTKTIPVELALTNNMSFILNTLSSNQEINVEKTNEETKFIYNIYSAPGKNLIVYIDPKEKLDDNKMKIAIYNTDIHGPTIKPLVLLDQFNVLPSAIAVDKTEMRIEIWGKLSKIKFTIKHVDDKDCQTVSSYNSTFQVSSNRNCSWFIPRDDSNQDHTVLSANSLTLPKGSSLHVTRLAAKSTTQILQGPKHESYLADFIMPSSYDYLIEFIVDENNKDKDTNIFIAKKAYLLHYNNTIIEDQHKFSVKSINYPGLYPIGFEQDLMIPNKDQYVLITVNDIQLYDHHFLSLTAKDLSRNFTNDVDIKMLPDYVAYSDLAVAFNTNNSLLFGNSDRGFDIEMTFFGCGDIIDLSKTNTLKFNSSSSNYHSNPICIWQIMNSKSNGHLAETILNFNILMASTLAENEANLTIYDSISLRNSSIHRALCNETNGDCLTGNTVKSHYQGSIGSAFIVYDFSKSLTTKKNFSFEITIESSKCTNTKYNLSICSNGERCITELMACNGQNDCGDWSDELHCNTTFIPPKPNGGGSGVSIWVVLFILMPLGAILGILGYIYLPRLLMNVRHGRYSEFRSDMSEVS
ncbi:uncharacterized protein LOC124495529 [Dermatophagoides farinae]|uniref:uncharacterized protein LOC124495529 n=1 Tax=Dermatophagoides farinae TaxID=6954 RepID=UPI003F62E636